MYGWGWYRTVWGPSGWGMSYHKTSGHSPQTMVLVGSLCVYTMSYIYIYTIYHILCTIDYRPHIMYLRYIYIYTPSTMYSIFHEPHTILCGFRVDPTLITWSLCPSRLMYYIGPHTFRDRERQEYAAPWYGLLLLREG